MLQTLWYQVNNGQEIYVVGVIQDDDTVRGGTGWGAEFAKLCNKPLFVFDQEKDGWFAWSGEAWKPLHRDADHHPPHFTGTGTRHVQDNARRAIDDLITKSFEATGPSRGADRSGMRSTRRDRSRSGASDLRCGTRGGGLRLRCDNSKAAFRAAGTVV